MLKTILTCAVLIVTNSLILNAQIIDFGNQTGGQYWSVTNDGVMGGLSRGNAWLSDSSVIFKGEVSLDNNGGFSSLRSSYNNLDLSGFNSAEVRLRASGLDFSITFAKSRRFYIPNFKHVIKLKSTEWEVVTFDLDQLKEYRIGNATGNTITPTDLKNLVGISFINEGKKEGPFVLEVDYIKFK